MVMTTLGERVRAERMANGWTQRELADRVTWAAYSLTFAAIGQMERRGDSNPKSIVQLAEALGVSASWLASGFGDRLEGVEQMLPRMYVRPARRRLPNGMAPVPPAFLQVFAAAQGGEDGEAMLTNEPVAWIPRDTRLDGVRGAYGCLASGDSMEPAYERGNLLLVNPAAAVSPGDDCVFLREAEDGTRWALIRRLVESNDDSWKVRQFNPERTYMLSRKEWEKAHLAIAKYNRWT